jgi:hypothetical protein
VPQTIKALKALSADSPHSSPALSSLARAGAHTRREVRSLQKEWLKRSWRIPAIVAALGAALVILTHFLAPDALRQYLIGAIVASCVWWVYTLMLEMSGLAAKRSGILAEERTSAELTRLHRDGWRTANHIMLKWRDVDHAAIGPAGIFAIETKFRSSWSTVDADSLARQARDDARRLALRIDPKKRATPLVVVWGPASREIPESFEHDGVVFCRGSALVDHLKSLGESMRPGEIAEAFDRLEQNVQRRDKGEVEQHGPFVRPASHALTDIWLISLATLITLVLVMAPSRLQPAGLWTVLTSLAVSLLAMLTRGKVQHPRVRYTAVGVFTMAAGIGGLMLTTIVLEAVG